MTHNLDLDEIRVASPCPARWDDMTGNDQVRFCGQCRKNVYNLSALRRVEAENLIREKEGQLCGRFYRRSDGRILTADCPAEAVKRRNRLVRWSSAVMAFALFLLNGCARTATTGSLVPKVTPLGNQKPVPEPTLGMICVPATHPPVPPNESAK